ncbi:MAG: hypothetical protein EOP63_14050 [Sphingomonadales bacterium]|nr:MAG: hypothetical protein EOP63_14050 [Sphingomonadales bacterium]
MVANRGRAGFRLRQGGEFDDDILCELHERITGDLDRYGVDFVRRVNSLGGKADNIKAFDVPNPSPENLKRFVLSVVWREVFAKNGLRRGLNLGIKTHQIRDLIFDSTTADFPLFVTYERFTAGSNERVPVGIHPFRIRFMDRIFWQFTVAGCAFFVGTDQRKTIPRFDWLRADINDPARAIIGDQRDIATVGILKPLLRDMTTRRKGRAEQA